MEVAAPDIKDISEALKWLYLLVERGEARLKEKRIRHVYPESAKNLLRAMIAGVKAALGEVDKTERIIAHGISEAPVYAEKRLAGKRIILIALANAYAPNMVKLLWTPKP